MWQRVVVDDEVFFWRAYTVCEELADGSFKRFESVVVARQPYEEGIHADGVSSRSFPPGTTIGEAEVIAAVRWLKDRGSSIP